MRIRQALPTRVAVAATAVVTGLVAAAIAIAATQSGTSSYSGTPAAFANRLVDPANSGPNGTVGPSSTLLAIPEFGSLTVTGCDVSAGSYHQVLSFANASSVPIDVIPLTANGNPPTVAPGTSATITYLNGGSPGEFEQTFTLGGGTGTARRVATVTLAGWFDATANACVYDVLATRLDAGTM